MLRIVSLLALLGLSLAQSSSSSYYSKPSSYSSSSSYYSKPSTSYSYSSSSSSYYSKPSSSYYSTPSSSSYSYYSSPSSSYYSTPSSYSYSSSYYTKPKTYSYTATYTKGYYFPSTGSYYNYFYGQSYAYSVYGYTGGYYGAGTSYGYNPACPYGCTVNGFCGTQAQCASMAAGGVIFGVIFGLVALCILCCVCAICCCGKKGGDAPQGEVVVHHEMAGPPPNSDAPFEGRHHWEGMFFQNGNGNPVQVDMTVDAGEIRGEGNDPIGFYTINGDTDGTSIRFRKEYQNQPPVFYEGHFVGDRRRIEGQYGFAPGQMGDQFWFNLMH